jgi:hypothetical protein
MNGNKGGSRRRSPLRQLGAQAAATAAVALLAAACGGGGGNGGGSSGSGGSTTYQKELAFSQCMRAHGEPNFPDPGSNGVIAIKGGGAASSGSPSKDQHIGGPQMTKANNACRHLLPNGGVPTAAQRQQMLKQGLKFAECMRAHGVSNFPDPKLGGGPVTSGGGINPNSPQFQSAQHACQNLLHKGGGLQIPA